MLETPEYFEQLEQYLSIQKLLNIGSLLRATGWQFLRKEYGVPLEVTISIKLNQCGCLDLPFKLDPNYLSTSHGPKSHSVAIRAVIGQFRILECKRSATEWP